MTPTYAQLEKLRTEADAQAGYVFDGETKIWGTYFCDAAVEGAPVFNNVDREITAAELEKGIFLPKAGRRSNNSSSTVISATQQATYRASTYIGSGVCNAGSEKGREGKRLPCLGSLSVVPGLIRTARPRARSSPRCPPRWSTHGS